MWKKDADGNFVLTPLTMMWIASMLDDSCNCAVHGDHAKCINEVEDLIDWARKQVGC